MNMRAGVDVVVGIEVLVSAKLLGKMDFSLGSGWQFLERFDASHHWTQRNLCSFCDDLPDKLRVTQKLCWIDDFRKYVHNANERFPIASKYKFEELMSTFLHNGLTGISSSKDFLWVQDGKVVASRLQFAIDVSNFAATSEALEHQAMWDDYVSTWNLNAQNSARGAWQTSSLWVRAEAQSKLISSTAVTLVIVMVLAGAFMVLFTFDLVLSLSVVVASMVVECGLASFIINLMGWSIGPIEVIALIVFIGYAVTYSLHIAHRYGSDEVAEESPEHAEFDVDAPQADIRLKRVISAFKSIGFAAIGSAITTIGCSIFLLFCTLTIFKKLGGVVLAVTLMSITVAMVPLPAALLICGPVNPGSTFPSLDNIKRGSGNLYSWLQLKATEWGICEPLETAAPESPTGAGFLHEPASSPDTRSVADSSRGAQQGGDSPARSSRDRGPSHSPRQGGRSQEREPQPAGAAAEAERRKRLSEMEFDIGTECRLEHIWNRDEKNGKVRGTDSGSPRAKPERKSQSQL